MHIHTIAQGRPEDNQVEFLQGPHGIVNPPKNLVLVVKICSWTRRLREIRAVGGPEVGWGWKDGGEADAFGGGEDAWGV